MLELTPNSKIDNELFAIRQISKKTGQNSKDYYSLQLSKGIKSYDGKIWNAMESYEKISPGDIVSVTGSIKEFKGNVQIHITQIKRIEKPTEEDRKSLIPTSSKGEEELRDDFNKIVSTIESPYIRELIDKLFEKEDIKDGFFKRSAGAEIHHAYIGGLAEHSIEVANNTIHFCKMGYPIKYDIAVVIALLHDIGKIYELSDFPENKYTSYGKMLGHISIGAMLIQNTIEEIKGFPEDTKNDILHGILSHHGNIDMGSPVVPMTIEAITVHNADKASAEINAFYLTIQRDNSSSNWTEYHNIFKRAIKKY